jgi:hypothetical protein
LFTYGYGSVGVGADGTIYTFDSGTYLSALQASVPLAKAPWPKFRANARNTGRQGE